MEVSGGQVKPVTMAASVSSLEVLQDECASSVVADNTDGSSLLFIRDGLDLHAHCDVKVPICILRATVAFDSYSLEFVLPFSKKTDTGDKYLMRGMGMGELPVLMHWMSLNGELV